jgi:hypothetical protein
MRLPSWQKAVLGSGILLILLGTGLFVYTYSHFSDLIDQRLSGQVFENASLVFAAPTEIGVGDGATPEEIVARQVAQGVLLWKATTTPASAPTGSVRIGWRFIRDRHPSSKDNARSSGRTCRDRVQARKDRFHHRSRTSDFVDSYLLEPEIITTLFDQSRAPSGCW